jgi:hypothetical protein
MALLFYDGFEQYQSPSGVISPLPNALGTKFQWWNLSGAPVSPGRNNYGYCLLCGALWGALTTPLTTAFFGFAARFNLLSHIPCDFQINDLGEGDRGITPQLIIRFNFAAQTLDVVSANVTRVSLSIEAILNSDAWNYFEVALTIGTLGSIRIRINGEPVIDATGINIQTGTRPMFDAILLVSPDFIRLDDFYIADTAIAPGGIPFNDFAGMVRVVTLAPIGAGAFTQWTPLALTNWAEVAVSDGDVSYNSTGTAGAKDMFHFTALSGTIAVVLAVQVIGAYRKDGAGSHSVVQHLVSGGIDSIGVSYAIPSDVYVYCTDIYPVNPATGTSWTVAAINDLQAGYELTL